MKYIEVILLLSTSGIEKFEIKTHGLDCGEMAKAWREVNTKYYHERDNNPKLQGHYTPDGKLMVGYICS